MELLIKDYKDFYYYFKNGINLGKYKEFDLYKEVLNIIFNSMDLYHIANEKVCEDFIKNIVNLVTRNNNYEVIDENLIQVISNSRGANIPDLFYDLLSSIVEPKDVAKNNINTLVTTFYILLIDTMYYWEEATHDKQFITPFSRVKIVDFKNLMLYIFSLNVDKVFYHTKYSVRDDTTKLFLFCNILAYTYLYCKRYDLIDAFLSNSDYYLEKLRINGIDYEPGYSKLDPKIGKKLFNFIETFFTVNEKKKIIL